MDLKEEEQVHLNIDYRLIRILYHNLYKQLSKPNSYPLVAQRQVRLAVGVNHLLTVRQALSESKTAAPERSSVRVRPRGDFIFINFIKKQQYDFIMAATPKGPQMSRLDVNIDKATYDTFVKTCAQRGFSSKVIIEKLVKKFNETGQI